VCWWKWLADYDWDGSPLRTSEAKGSRVPSSWGDKVGIPSEGLTSDVGPWDSTSEAYLLYSLGSGRWYKETWLLEDGASYSLVASNEEQLLVSEAEEGETLPDWI
jgi:hypothetical protein